MVWPIEDYVTTMGLWHSWDMLSPDPLSIVSHVQARVRFQDGSVATWDFPRMEQLGLWERFQKEPSWISGLAVYYTSRLPEFWRFPVPYVFEHLWTIKLWTWSTLLVELALGTLVWVKSLRYWVLLAGVVLHLGID